MPDVNHILDAEMLLEDGDGKEISFQKHRQTYVPDGHILKAAVASLILNLVFMLIFLSSIISRFQESESVFGLSPKTSLGNCKHPISNTCY